MTRGPHVYTPAHDPGRAVFLPLMTQPQPDTAERVRLAVQSIAFGLPEKKRKEAECP